MAKTLTGPQHARKIVRYLDSGHIVVTNSIPAKGTRPAQLSYAYDVLQFCAGVKSFPVEALGVLRAQCATYVAVPMCDDMGICGARTAATMDKRLFAIVRTYSYYHGVTCSLQRMEYNARRLATVMRRIDRMSWNDIHERNAAWIAAFQAASLLFGFRTMQYTALRYKATLRWLMSGAISDSGQRVNAYRVNPDLTPESADALRKALVAVPKLRWYVEEFVVKSERPEDWALVPDDARLGVSIKWVLKWLTHCGDSHDFLMYGLLP